MARTMFVNPSFVNPRRKRGKKSKRSHAGRRRHKRGGRGSRRSQRFAVSVRRNAGIAPFIQNPLILSNPPRRRRHRRKNPLSLPGLTQMFESFLSWTGGAGLALATNTLGTSKIKEPWIRRGVQGAAAAFGGALIGQKSSAMGGAFAGALLYPLMQDVAADLLGVGVAAGSAAAQEADIDALAADLEDVMDEMDDDGGYGDDDDEEEAW